MSGCALILLNLSKNWKPGDGKTSTVSDARALLAPVIYAFGQRGFTEPAPVSVVKKEALQDDWKDCVAAVRAVQDAGGQVREPVGNRVVFWVADQSNPGKLGDPQGLGLQWPFRPDSHIARVSGPILDGTDPKPKRLFFFDSINEAAATESDVDASPGLWPKAASPQDNDPSRSVTTQPQQPAVGARRPWMATALFAVWIASGIILALWLWLAGDFVRAAVANFETSAANCIAMKPSSDSNAPPVVDPTAWKSDCDTGWGDAWKKAKSDVTGGRKGGILPWIGANLAKNATLTVLVPLVIAMGSIVVLMLAAGMAAKGLWFGVLIDDSRNRMSLSRAQQVAWTILIIASLAIMGWFNAAMATGASPSSGWTLFPSIPAALWAALGLNLFATPYLSSWILDKKDPTLQIQVGEPNGASPAAVVPPPATGPSQATQLVRPARLDTNDSTSEASWIDLVTGETEGTDHQLDLSRIQYLIISGALLSSYFMALANLLGDINGRTIMTAAASGNAVFASMPEVAGTFLGLLVLSHAGYLAFKATAPATASGDAGKRSGNG
jgi:hypothetical protein